LSDIIEAQQSEVTRIASPDESNLVEVSSINELQVNDVPEQGTSTTLTLTTTAVLFKVGASVLSNRKYIEMQAIDKNVKWGYTTNCDFDLFKNQFFSLPAGENCNVYLKASTGTADIAISEK